MRAQWNARSTESSRADKAVIMNRDAVVAMLRAKLLGLGCSAHPWELGDDDRLAFFRLFAQAFNAGWMDIGFAEASMDAPALDREMALHPACVLEQAGWATVRPHWEAWTYAWRRAFMREPLNARFAVPVAPPPTSPCWAAESGLAPFAAGLAPVA